MRPQTKKNGRELLVILSLWVEHTPEPGEKTRIDAKVIEAFMLYGSASTVLAHLSQSAHAVRSKGDPYTDSTNMIRMNQIWHVLARVQDADPNTDS